MNKIIFPKIEKVYCDYGRHELWHVGENDRIIDEGKMICAGCKGVLRVKYIREKPAMEFEEWIEQQWIIKHLTE